jgi:hypothetical protein
MYEKNAMLTTVMAVPLVEETSSDEEHIKICR